MESNYFDTEDIIATQNKVMCRLEADIPRLGFLNPASGKADLERNQKMELPFWLAEELATSSKVPLVSVEIPKEYSSNFREILDADATAVNLNGVNPHFYQFGAHLLKFESDDRRKIGESLVEAFRRRVGWLMSKATQGVDEEAPKEMERKEKEILLRGRAATRESRKRTLQFGPSNLKRRNERCKRKYKEVF